MATSEFWWLVVNDYVTNPIRRKLPFVSRFNTLQNRVSVLTNPRMNIFNNSIYITLHLETIETFSISDKLNSIDRNQSALTQIR